jgi:hypothetical protein
MMHGNMNIKFRDFYVEESFHNRPRDKTPSVTSLVVTRDVALTLGTCNRVLLRFVMLVLASLILVL